MRVPRLRFALMGLVLVAVAATVSLIQTPVAKANAYDYSTMVLGDGASDYWKFDEASGNVIDYGPGLQNGALFGGYNQNNAGPTAFAKAVSFDGTSGYMSVVWNGSYNQVGPYSIEAWVRPVGLTGQNMNVVSSHDAVEQRGYTLNVDPTGHAMFCAGTSTGSGSTAYVCPSSTNPLTIGTWSHLVGVLRFLGGGKYEADIYVNGVLSGSMQTTNTPIFNYRGPFMVGAGNPSGVISKFFDGDIAYVSYYPRALSTADVQNHLSQMLALGAPYPLGPMSITGDPTLGPGTPLGVNKGAWAGVAPIAFTYQWQRCYNSLPSTCQNIPGANLNTYTVSPSDGSATLRVLVTGSDVNGARTKPTSFAAAVPATAPVNIVTPTVAGMAEDQQTLNGNPGIWGGSPNITLTYQWQTSSDGGTTWQPIVNATHVNYTLTPAEIGKLIRFSVTATNIVGSTTANSLPAGPVIPMPPVNLSIPTINGLPATQGFALTALPGNWNGSPTIVYTYQWQFSSDGGATWASIPGATGTSYTPQLADVGTNLRVEVTGTNAGGSTAADSAMSAAVVALPPTNTALPTITGVPMDGNTLNGSNGTWTGSPPINYTYQWQTSSDNGVTWNPIAGATTINYTVLPSDVGNVLRLKVTATNGGGSTIAYSLKTSTVVSQPPANSGGANAPFITGTAQDTQVLTAHNGVWTGTTPITYTYQWQLSSDGGTTWLNITGATFSTYTLPTATIGDLIRVQVTGTNPGGNSTANSASVGPVVGVIPNDTTPPSIAGIAKDTQTLTGNKGVWVGSAPIAYTYQWQDSSDGGTTWNNIGGATAINYTIPTAEIGNNLRLAVTATNVAGATTDYSPMSAVVVGNPPVNTAVPVVSGALIDAGTVTTTNGTWTGSAPISFTYQWQDSTDNGVTWTDIAGATASSYVITSGEIGRRLRSVVTGTNVAGSTSAHSVQTTPVGAIIPANAGGPDLPYITGVPQDGQTLTENDGVWSGSPTITYTYQWQFSNNGGTTWNNMAGQTAQTLVLAPAQIGQLIRVKVTATNSGGSTSTFALAVGPVTAIPTANTVLPLISGTVQDGHTLATTTGTWTGSPTITYTYQWQSSPDNATWSNIVGATSSTYPLTPAYIGKYIQVIVTATNAAGGNSATANSVGPVTAIPAANTVLPALSGLAQETQTLSTTNGTWTGSPTITFTYQWQTSSDNGVTWTNLGGATASSYTVVATDIGNKLRACVTGTNAAGPTVACSNPTATVLGNVPVNTVAPLVTGTAQDQQTLSTTDGTWTGTAPIGFTYQWYSAPAAGGPWSAIGGATANTYTLQPAQIGKYIKVTITATNVAGSTNKDSNVIGPVTAIPTANTVAPNVTGTTQDGQVLTTDSGTWTGSPVITYTYQWQYSNDGGTSWFNLAGATSTTYTLLPAQIGDLIRSRVTATNAAGGNTVSSNVVGPVVGIPPVNTVTPVASGTAKDQQTLTVTNGTWTGSPVISFTYQWQSSSDGGTTWTNIAGATASNYVLQPSDIGNLVRAEVTGMNMAGSAAADSNSLGPVAAIPPSNTSLPIVSGTVQDGQTITTTNGTWIGSPTLTYTYQWQYSTDGGVTWNNQAGATSNSLLLTSADVGHRMRVQVTATNAFGPVTANSNMTIPVGAIPPSNTVAPVLSGAAQDGQLDSVTTGTWAGSTPLAYTYQWQSAPAAGGPWSSIPGATANSYTLTPTEIGKYIRVQVTATNTGGNATANSNVIGPVTAIAVVNTVSPVASGTAQDFQTISTTQGTWTGSPTITYSYQWQFSTDGGLTFSNIPGATANSYTLVSAYVGDLVRAQVTGTNAAGSTNAYSNQLGPVTGVPPSNSSAPVLSGTMQQAQTISTTNGTWTGSTPINYTYQWQSSTDGGVTWSNIVGATAANYTLQASDAYNYVRSCVTATNMAGSASQCSATSPQIVGLNPLNTVAPVASGTAEDSFVLSTTNGTWTGSAPINYTYQWQHSSDGGTTWTNIAGATASTYTLQPSDVGDLVRAQVTATNPTGATTQPSNSLGPVTPLPPSNTVAPVISGTTTDGQLLSSTNGTWTGTPVITYTYQWQSAAAVGGPYSNIVGATASTYTLTPNEIGKYVRLQVKGTNAAGNSTANSNVLGPVAAIPPSNSGGANAPSISGTAQETQTLTANNGTWAGSPVITYTYQWQSSTDGGATWSNIVGATAGTYVPVNGDIGKDIRVNVTGTNAGGNATASSALVGPVTGVPPSNTAVPTVSGTVADGQTITTTNGTWTGSAVISFTYQWQYSTDGGTTWSNIVGATASNYSIPFGTYTGDVLRSCVTGTNMAGNATACSAKTTAVSVAPPVNTVAPVASGGAQDGQTLSVTNGTWTGTPVITYTYQWQFSTDNGVTWSNIAGATANSYVLPYGTYTGDKIRAQVTATNGGGPVTANSNVLGPVIAAPPVNTVLPTVGGTAQDGQALNGANGTWVGTPVITYTYQWQFSTDNGVTWSNIAGATAINYTLPYGTYTGDKIRLAVTGTNSAGSSTADSASTVAVAGAAPVNTVAPVASGSAQDGQTLSTTNGTWTGTPVITYTYQWQFSTDNGVTWSNIAGATASNYAIPFGTYTGDKIRAQVTGTNAYGNATANSNVLGPITVAAPVNTVAPVASGTPTDGQTLSTTNGTWTGTPVITYTYQWQFSSNGGTTWNNIAGATANTYVLPYGTYTGDLIRAQVTASNGGGPATASSNALGPINVAPPVNTVSPTVTGVVKDGQTLGSTNGTWVGTPVITYTYQWQFSTDGGTTWSNIAGATAANYTIPYGTYTGDELRIAVTGTNSAGASTANSAATVAVAGAAPVNTVAPVASGVAQDGQTISVTNGTWTGTPAITYTYQWQFSTDNGVTWNSIAGATASSYVIPFGTYTGDKLRAQVTGTNAYGNSTANSNVLGPVLGTPPVNTVSPVASGAAQDGQIVSTTTGTWTGTPVITYTYQWQFSSNGGTTWNNIVGATASTYTLPYGTYTGDLVRAQVTGTNASGNSTANSNTLGPVVAAPPSNTVAPALGGTMQDGQTITTTNGTWVGTPVITYTYQWQYSTDGGTTWNNIVGATANNYVLPYGAYTGDDVRAQVTANNSAGSTVAYSNVGGPIAGAAPINTAIPTITGVVQDGNTVGSTTGTWTGTPAITYTYQWQYSTDGGATWNSIAGATSSTYAIPFGTYTGDKIRIGVTGTNAYGNATAYSAASTIAGTAPVNTVLPVISGTVQDGQTLSTTNGTWTGSPVITYTYQWQYSTDGGTTWNSIAGATSNSYSLPYGTYTGDDIRVQVKGTNAYGNSTANSLLVGPVAGAPPVNTFAPLFTGTAQDGNTLTAVNGAWTGTPVITYTYQWQYSTDGGATYSNIPAATANSYAIPYGTYTGDKIRLGVTGTNGYGNATAYSAGAVIAGAPPVNTVAPGTSGTVADGQTLGSTNGTWTGTPAITYTYQWQYSTASTGPWTSIGGATASTFAIPYNTYTGDYFQICVKGTNAYGNATACSGATAQDAGAAPSNTVPPVASGTVQDGQTLSTTTGTWVGTGANNYTYQWQYSTDGGVTWTNIPAATSSTYALPYGTYTGDKVRAVVTDTNAYGNSSQTSNVLGPVAGAAPVNTAIPTITGTVFEGNTVTANNGTWTGTPVITYTYQWQYSTDGGTTWSNVPGATSQNWSIPLSTYTGDKIRVAVTGTNTYGNATANSAASTVGGAPPSNLTIPQITGVAKIGSTLTGSTGTWSGGGITYTYQWERCDYQGNTCSNIPGATATTYTPVAADKGSTLRIIVTATNAFGNANATSNATDEIVDSSISVTNVATPSLSANGSTLTYTTAASIPAGDTLIVMAEWDPNGASAPNASFSDNSGLGYTWNPYEQNNQGNQIHSQYYSAYINRTMPSGTTLTLTLSGSGKGKVFELLDVQGLDPANLTDQALGAVGNSGAMSSGTTGTTTLANELAVASMAVNGPVADTYTPGGGWTMGTRTNAGANTLDPMYQILSATGTVTATATIAPAHQWEAAVVTFKTPVSKTW